ncbi:hypothetical protein PSH66_25340 [Pseudomonas sp. FP597]|uniref:hypothetical protein n=1 Tax=Pseudomonas sp. FP597 TaxID=2954096 RepID=UPI0027327343|nr:hypothetical protein [Pseudomonas sp. FP597]WLI05873.1 hypothetical protein PSH66_25340 [Pseudomonas sp. FP597]
MKPSKYWGATFDATMDELLSKRRALAQDMLSGASDIQVSDFESSQKARRAPPAENQHWAICLLWVQVSGSSALQMINSQRSGAFLVA